MRYPKIDGLILSVCALAGLAGCLAPGPAAKEIQAAPASAVVVELPGEDPNESQLIEEALVAQGYFNDEIPLIYELQDELRTACEAYGIPYPLALALIETESTFQVDAVNADSGCYGLCQLNPRYFPADLTPAQNIWAGMDYLAFCLERYGGDTEAALTAYNAGHDTGDKVYANKVMKNQEKWEEILNG